jgi:DNA-binding LacI/PurR family transcriptional regulator
LIMQLGDDKNNRLLIERLYNFRIDKAVVFAAPIFAGHDSYDWWLQTTRKNPEIRFLLYDYRINCKQKGLVWPENVHITGFDALLAYQDIVEYIAAAGYTSFHLFNASKSHPAVQHSRKIGLKVHAHGKIVGETNLFKIGERIGAQLAKLPNPRQVAVFIGDDTVTISTVKYLLERGFRVPEDFAFISWDGLAISEYFLRTVTTLEIPHTKMLSYAKNFVTGNDCEQSLIVTPIIRVGETMPQKKCVSP